MNDDKIINKLEDIDGKVDILSVKISNHDKQFEKIDSRFDKHDDRFDKLSSKIIEINERTNGLATQESISTLHENIMKLFDDQSVILQRLDQERVFTIERIKRIENEVEDHSQKLLR